MARGIEIAGSPKKEKPKVTFNLYIPKDHSLFKSFNMKGLGVGKPHSMRLHGKITSLREDENEKSIGFEVSSIGEKGEAKGSSVGDIIKGLHSKEDKKKGGAESEEA